MFFLNVQILSVQMYSGVCQSHTHRGGFSSSWWKIHQWWRLLSASRLVESLNSLGVRLAERSGAAVSVCSKFSSCFIDKSSHGNTWHWLNYVTVMKVRLHTALWKYNDSSSAACWHTLISWIYVKKWLCVCRQTQAGIFTRITWGRIYMCKHKVWKKGHFQGDTISQTEFTPRCASSAFEVIWCFCISSRWKGPWTTNTHNSDLLFKFSRSLQEGLFGTLR